MEDPIDTLHDKDKDKEDVVFNDNEKLIDDISTSNIEMVIVFHNRLISGIMPVALVDRGFLRGIPEIHISVLLLVIGPLVRVYLVVRIIPVILVTLFIN